MITYPEYRILTRYGCPGGAYPAALLKAYWEVLLDHPITTWEFSIVLLSQTPYRFPDFR